MKSKPFKLVPGLIALAVILFVCLLRLLRLEFFERLECITYDIRARQALKFSPTVATNLGFVYINEDSVRSVWNGSVGFHFGLYWPRQVYGRVVDELAQQGAKAVAFDVLFGELRPDHPAVQLRGTNFPDSDEWFADQMCRASNVIIALTEKVTPPSLFVTNAMAVGDITTEKDPDGILRRVQVFRFYTNWHSAFQQVEANPEYGVDLTNVVIQPTQITLRRPGAEDIKIALDQNGDFDIADFGGGPSRKAKPFTVRRAWHMGVVLAACELNLDLDKADIDLPNGRITLHSPSGVQRNLPVDKDGYFYVDWCLPPNHPALTREPIQNLLLQDKLRLQDQTEGLTNRWRGKLAVIGSAAQIGNNLTDRGATPLSRDTLLVSKHWNVANSIIMGRFVRRSPLIADLALIVLLGVAAAVLTWELSIPKGLALVAGVGVVYGVVAVALFIQTRIWIPIPLPVLALLVSYIGIVAWRVVFEQEARRVLIASFGKVVSKKILDVILASENLSLGGTRREITVLFADMRGFTEFTDTSQERVENYIKENKLTGAAAEAYIDEQARDTLDTVNKYLGLVADTIIQHDAVLDKFIGDCVMAFWGAPTPYPGHAVACVRAAIAAQRAINDFNQKRAIENKSRELENQARLSAGLPPKQMLPLLLLGSGINTGMATAGWMGSASETKNYTVFGLQVNLASRLEALSGRGRIFISEATYKHLLRDDPALAATCILQPPQKVKGIAATINVYEVPWRPQTEAPVAANDTTITSLAVKAQEL